MTNTKKSLVAAGILTALIAGNVATAAVVPAGVQLAEKQTLVRNNGSKFSPSIRIKSKGCRNPISAAICLKG